MALLYQSTARVRMFLMVDSTDHRTGKTGLTVTLTISKNGGAFASAGGSVTEVSNGWYKISLNTTDTNTLGDLAFHVTATGADDRDWSDEVVAINIQDGVRAGLTALPNAAAEAAGGLYTRGSGAGQINQTNNGQIDVNAARLGGTTQTGRDIGASVLISSGTGTGQLSVSAGVIQSDVAKVNGQATLTEMSVAAPPKNPTPAEAMMYPYMGIRNKQTSGGASGDDKFITVHNDAGTPIYKKEYSDDGFTYTEEKAVSG